MQTVDILALKLETLPSFDVSPILYEALQLLDDPDAQIDDLAELITLDKRLTARLLETAKEHSKRPLTDIHQALKFMGMGSFTMYIAWVAAENELSNCLDSTVFDLLQGPYWPHSQVVAICAHLLAEEVNYPNPDEAFAAGLFHEVGLSILDHVSAESLLEALEVSDPEHCQLIVTSEDQLAGLNHGCLAAEILECWGLPKVIVQAVMNHHEPSKDPQFGPLAAILHLADVAVECERTGLPLGIRLFPLDEQALTKLGLSKNRVLAIAKEARSLFSRAKQGTSFVGRR